MPWYKDWFNSPYYHKLYGKRDAVEAEKLIDNLIRFLEPKPEAVFLDLACGKGRHARQMASYGFTTFGVDLSEESILAARQSALPNLSFEVHDMRKVFKPGHFDFVFNLFTSFGYFDSDSDNLETLKSVHADLKENGLFIQDYFNSYKVERLLVNHEVKNLDGIEFNIEKHIQDKKVFKSIKFLDKSCEYRFYEQVSLFSLDDFKSFYDRAGFEIKHVFGSYELQAFDEVNSDRLILISSKK